MDRARRRYSDLGGAGVIPPDQKKLRAAVARSEESMQLDEVQLLMLGIVLRNSIVPAKARAYLHELNRREFIHHAPARLLAIAHRAVWIEEFVRDLQVVAAGDEPIRLEQRGELLTLLIGDA